MLHPQQIRVYGAAHSGLPLVSKRFHATKTQSGSRTMFVPSHDGGLQLSKRKLAWPKAD